MRQHAVSYGVRKLAIGSAVLLFLLSMIPAVAFAAGDTYTVKVDKSYLALRTAPAFDASNEIGKLYTGDTVELQDSQSNASYWKVYSSKYNRSGWVNKNYLVYKNKRQATQGDYRVKVDKNYLALRTAPAFDWNNEIGELYTGDTVSVVEKSGGQYWWVYSPKYDRSGDVNKDYLTPITSANDYTVKVNKGYLALRTKPAYNSSNEIGELYTGDVVTLKEKLGGQYWWVYSSKYDREGYVNKDYLIKR